MRDYSLLLDALVESDWRIVGVGAFLSAPETQSVVLRHDVDRRPHKAIAMAELEAGRAVRSTYYFRADIKGRFPDDSVRRIAEMGHEVGYHYETLSDCDGDKERALQLFKRNLLRLREVAQCITVSMHGKPLSNYNNIELLQKAELADFELIGDAVISMQEHRPIYYTDVGGRWNHPTLNIRDAIPNSRIPDAQLSDPRSVVSSLNATYGPIYLNSHPERWAAGPLDSAYCLLFDMAANAAKRFLKALR